MILAKLNTGASITTLPKRSGSCIGALRFRSMQLEHASPTRPGHLLRTFGQSNRDQISNANDEASVGQALALLNSPLSKILSHPDAALQQGMAKAASPSDKLDFLYVSFLSRHPDRDEKAVLDQVLRDRGDTALADVLHALLTGAQFVFIQ
jgi:hypothetical protein